MHRHSTRGTRLQSTDAAKEGKTESRRKMALRSLGTAGEINLAAFCRKAQRGGRVKAGKPVGELKAGKPVGELRKPRQ